ncbi:hypothetical protein [Brachybacterium sp. YJGR34]|uniref:hypothetical protein n=1 Tax=Brachybacterium sp. YJGR34 TaxID=2059911 RepID=UPI000E0C5CF1|nr:hypothetical protein [Brachybacterium sp. YJGR34]
MGIFGGRSERGPGGDPSWLGGKDRDRPEPPVAGSGDMPAFEAPPSEQNQQVSWAPSFGEPDGEAAESAESTPRTLSTAQVLRRIAFAVIPMVIIIVVAVRMDVSWWWVLVVMGAPFIRRGKRLLEEVLRR